MKVSKATTRSTLVYVPTGSARSAHVIANQQERGSEKTSPEPQASVPAVESGAESSDVNKEGIFSIFRDGMMKIVLALIAV